MFQRMSLLCSPWFLVVIRLSLIVFPCLLRCVIRMSAFLRLREPSLCGFSYSSNTAVSGGPTALSAQFCVTHGALSVLFWPLCTTRFVSPAGVCSFFMFTCSLSRIFGRLHGRSLLFDRINFSIFAHLLPFLCLRVHSSESSFLGHLPL